jgi:hypothetical protein
MSELRGYERTIADATGVSDRNDIAEIEDTMRHVIFHSTLDWQTREQLAQAAREAWEVVRIMRDPKAMSQLGLE